MRWAAKSALGAAVFPVLPVVLAALFLIACPDSEREGMIPDKVAAPSSMKACAEDSQCVLVHSSCNGCCQRDAVNRKDSAAYEAYRPTKCVDKICAYQELGTSCAP